MRDTDGDPRDYDGPIRAEPDPEAVGPSVMAWYALHGTLDGGAERAAETLARAAGVLSDRLAAIGPNVVNPLTPQQQALATKEAQMLLGLIAELFDANESASDREGALAFAAELKKPRRGRPAQTELRPTSLGWWGVAMQVEALIAEGHSQKEAVGKLAERLELKDRTIAEWVRERRDALNRSTWLSDDPENSEN